MPQVVAAWLPQIAFLLKQRQACWQEPQICLMQCQRALVTQLASPELCGFSEQDDRSELLLVALQLAVS